MAAVAKQAASILLKQRQILLKRAVVVVVHAALSDYWLIYDLKVLG